MRTSNCYSVLRVNGWLIGIAAVVVSCGTPASTPASDDTPEPAASTVKGKAKPAARTALDLARTTLDTLGDNDWDTYRPLLSNRADMLSLYADAPTHRRRERRRRRRAVWRRVNRLHDETAKEGFAAVRAEVEELGVTLHGSALVELRSMPSRDLPESSGAVELWAGLRGVGRREEPTIHWLALGTCAQVKRGWITLSPLRWSRWEPPDEAEVLFGDRPDRRQPASDDAH